MSYFFIYDFPLEYIVEGSLNNYITNGFLNYYYQNQFFLDFLTIHSDWIDPVDDFLKNEFYDITSEWNILQKISANLLYKKEVDDYMIIFNGIQNNIFFQDYNIVQIIEVFKVLDNYIFSYDYDYKLLITENRNFLNNVINNDYFYYLNISFYINFIYILIDSFINLNCFINSIFISLYNIKCFIYSYLFHESIEINNYIKNHINIKNINNLIFFIFYDFLNHCTYKVTMMYYIYLLYLVIINVMILFLFIKVIVYYLKFYYYLKFKIINLHILMEYITIMNLKLNYKFVNSNWLNLNWLSFEFNKNPNSTSFYMSLFFKKLKNIYIIKNIISFIISFKEIIIFLIKYILIIVINIFRYFYNIFFNFLKNKININYKYIDYLKNIKRSYDFSYLNPIYKFFLDRDKYSIKKFTSKEDKIFHDLIKEQQKEDILSNYWKYLQVFYYNYTYIMFVKLIRIILFFILFIIKFLIFKSFKYLIKLTIITKILHILIYYVLNIYLYFKLFIKQIYLKYIWYIYFKIKNNIIYFLNMFVHYKLFKLITRLFLYDSYYLNSEMIDKYPYYLNKKIINFFIWFDIIINKNKYHMMFLNNIITLKNFIIIILKNILNFIILIFIPFSIRFIYNIILIKIKIIKSILINNNIIKIILYMLIFIILNLYCYSLLLNIYNNNNIINIIIIFFFIIIICSLCITINKLHIINKFIWHIGFYLFLLYDLILLILKKLILINIILIKYLIFYPFLLYLIIIFLSNNPIIYIKFSYLLKLFLLPLFDILYSFMYTFNNNITLSFLLYDQISPEDFLSLETIWHWINYADGIYWEVWLDSNWWWVLKKINYRIFNYYTPFDYFWYEGFYAFLEIYEMYQYISNYIYIFVYILSIYYFWWFIYIMSKISYIFWWLNHLTINEWIFYFIYTSNIIYISLLKIYIYNYIYIFIPYYIIRPLLNIFTLLYEYYFIIKYMDLYFIKILKISVTYIYTCCNIPMYNIYIYSYYLMNNIYYKLYLLNYIIHNIVTNFYEYILFIKNIYMYFISDIIYNINLSYIFKYIYIYTNIDFFFYNQYYKIIILKDSFYSSFRFPIEYYNKLNNHKYFQKYYSFIKKERFEYLTKILSFDYETEKFAIARWRKKNVKVFSQYIINHYNDNLPKWYQMLNTQPHYSIKYIYYSYKILKFQKVLILFPYLWSLFWIYYIIIYIISSFIIIKLYKIIFNYEYQEKKKLYMSNTYGWDILCKETINNNYKLFKNNNSLYTYYFKQIVKSNKDYIINSKNILNDKKNLLSKNKYIYFYKNYIFTKNIIKNLLKKNYMMNYKPYISKFKLLLTLKNNFFSLHNNLMKYNKINHRITFDFKNLIIFNKYNWLYNMVSSEEKKFNLFSTYYYNDNQYIPYIYNHYYEEPFIDGAIKFDINEKNYNYLYLKLYQLYFFYKWLDENLLKNQGSFYLFHKDPRVPYISKDLQNNKYYYNTSIDYNNHIYILFIFITIPLIIWSTFLSSILHFTNILDYQFFDVFYMHLTFWLSWFMTQYTLLHEGILKIIFSFMGDSIYMFTLDHEEEHILSHGDTEFHNWFNYETRIKSIFPLYNYYNTKYYLFQIFKLNDNINPFSLILLHIKYFILNIYDILYVNYNLFDYYSFELIIYNICKLLFSIIFIIYIYIHNKYKFFNYKKISMNIYIYSYNLKNLHLKNINFLWLYKKN